MNTNLDTISIDDLSSVNGGAGEYRKGLDLVQQGRANARAAGDAASSATYNNTLGNHMSTGQGWGEAIGGALGRWGGAVTGAVSGFVKAPFAGAAAYNKELWSK
jgi:hypothetical protein